MKPTHPYARSRVYDLRNYGDAAVWGPFIGDGSKRVDWEKVESAMVVLGYNLRIFNERAHGRSPARRTKVFTGLSPGSFVPPVEQDTTMAEQDVPDLVAEDPYGITGEWMRVSRVCGNLR